MCGRARCTLNPQQVARACGIRQPPTGVRTVQMDRFRPTYNASPGSYMPVVMLQRDDEAHEEPEATPNYPNKHDEAPLVPVIHCMKWGLVPSFTKKNDKPDHFRMFNARSESIREKASFRRLVPKNRCLVAVEGFYEWKKDGSKKQPYYIHFKDDRPLVFPALYDMWVNSEGEVLHTFTILTTSSSSSLRWLHDRMPVIFGDQTSINEWLSSSPSKLDLLLKPYETSDLVWYPVTPAMGKVSFDGVECIKEIQLTSADSKPISKFFINKSDDVKVHPPFKVQNSVQESAKLVLSDNLKGERILGGVNKTSFNIKQSEEIEKETNLVGTMKKEPADDENKHFALDRIKRDPDILEVRHAKDLVKETKQFEAMKQEPQNGKNEEPLEDLKHDDSERHLESHGVKGEHNKMETKPSQRPVLATNDQVQPAAKKGKYIKTAGDRQSTLHSFFGKK